MAPGTRARQPIERRRRRQQVRATFRPRDREGIVEPRRRGSLAAAHALARGGARRRRGSGWPAGSTRDSEAGPRRVGARLGGADRPDGAGRLPLVVPSVVGRVHDPEALCPMRGALRRSDSRPPERGPRRSGGRAEGRRVGAARVELAGRRGGRGLMYTLYALYSTVLGLALVAYL